MNNKNSAEKEHPALALLRSILPSGVAWGMSFHHRLPNPAHLTTPARQRVFKRGQNAAGKECLNTLLRLAGLRPRKLLNGTGGQRIWPNGFVGSLTYKETVVLGALISTKNMKMLGIDLESIRSGSLNALTTTIAPEGLPTNLDNELATIFCFSAKESAFKAQYPLTRQSLGFGDIRLKWVKANKGSAKALATCASRAILKIDIVCDGQWVVSAAHS